jgi:hypothetical protein
LLSISGGGLTISSNLAAGGAIWNWTDTTGKQYINTDDYGREIQSDLTFADSTNAFGWQYRKADATEAGDGFSTMFLPPALRHGSPLLLAQNTSPTMQSTRAIPLEWKYQAWNGSVNTPVLWSHLKLGKDLTLNFDGLGSVVQYDSVVENDAGPIVTWHDVFGGNRIAPVLEAPTAYLTADFNRFWTYDPPVGGSGSPVEVFPPADSSAGLSFGLSSHYSTGRGGVIASTPDKSHAMGIYAASTMVGGSIGALALYNLPSSNASKMSAWVSPSQVPTGVTAFHTWILSGTLASVISGMDKLRSLDVR